METVTQMALICVYISMIIAQSTILYYFANELFDESLNIGTVAYESAWFDFDVVTQKTIQLLILRAQKPCAVRLFTVIHKIINSFRLRFFRS